MELFGLVTFVDEHVFGSEEAFRELYGKKSADLPAGVLVNLRARLAPICQRTLRKQVLEYVRYTKRIPITEDFTPSQEEQWLYDRVSAFLQRDNLHSLPNSQRQLIELVLRKILASSSFAIAATLLSSLDTEESLLITGTTDEGQVLDRETCEKLLTIPAVLGRETSIDAPAHALLEAAIQSQAGRVLADSQARNESFFDAESDKLDCWADDLKENLERELKSIELEIREAKKAKRIADDLQSKVAAQKRVNELEQQRNLKKRTLFDAQDQIELRKDSLIAEVEAKLQQNTTLQNVFTIRWSLE